MRPNREDFARIRALYGSEVPVVYTIGGRQYRGIPAECSPVVTRRRIDTSTVETVICGKTPEGVSVRAECTEYADHPVLEWVVYFANENMTDSPILSDINMEMKLPCEAPSLYHGNGDTCRPDGYEWWTDAVDAAGITLQPCGDGTSCNGAFPYMRLFDEKGGYNIAVGWSGTWKAAFCAIEGGTMLSVGQATFRSYLAPGETVRTPRLTLHAYEGGEDRARNLWRAFYIDRWLPREGGRPLSPKLILHTFMINGLPEFCGVTKENQIQAIDTYLANGLKPDIWWIDAGWYPCNNDWGATGTWKPNPETLPDGLDAVGAKLAREGIDLLLWFEPERVRPGTELWEEHPEFLLHYTKDDNPWLAVNALLNLGNPAACNFMIERIDSLIKRFGVTIYRQDFNFPPAPYWALHTEKDREGILENLHIQGYYRLWDELLARNPGLWMDSCASGGRRNDSETMRRAVPLHYTDVGYGDHRIKQKQHRQMFEWIPYFRAHTYSWDTPEGEYIVNRQRGVDEFAYQNALTPAVTSMIEFYHPEELMALGRRFHPVWRRAAEMELSCDYYPLTECRKDEKDVYAMQFDGENEGFVQIIRNIGVTDGKVCLKNLHVEEGKVYTFYDELGGRTLTLASDCLTSEGFCDDLPPRSGVIWFYRKADVT